MERISYASFYPFGMRITETDLSQVSGSPDPYQFNGKEWVAAGVLDMYDYGWRQYDASIGRWHCPDPADQYYSPYVFCGNNPIVVIDPDGQWAIWDDAVAMVVGGTINVIANWGKINSFGDGLKYFGIGAAAGELALYGGAAVAALLPATMGAIATGAIVGAAGGAVGGFANGSMNSWIMEGGGFMDGLAAGGMGAAWGAAGGAVMGAAMGAFSKTNLGQKFGKWYSNHSEGRFFDTKNSLSPFYKPKFDKEAYLEYARAQLKRDFRTDESMRQMSDDIRRQSEDLFRQFGQKNVKIQLDDEVVMHYDFKGATHKNVLTPHVQHSRFNVRPADGFIHLNKDNTWVRTMTQKDIDFIRFYFKLKK